MKTNKLSLPLLLIPILMVCLIFPNAHAGYLTIGESGELVKPENYRMGISPHVIAQGDSGVELEPFIDAGWTDSTSSRFSFGFGKIQFNLGASLKWVPYPDVDKQPAMGIKTAFFYAKNNDIGITTLQIAPLISKSYPSERGNYTPYASVAININSGEGQKTGSQFIMGSELRHPEAENFIFAAEFSLNLSNSFSGIAGFVSYPFDAKKGLKKR